MRVYRHYSEEYPRVGAVVCCRMTLICTALGLGSGGLFGLVVIIPMLLSGYSAAAILWSIVIGMICGGSFGLVFGLLGGCLMGRATDNEQLYASSIALYVRRMQRLGQSVALIGVFFVCFLFSSVTVPDFGWRIGLIGVLALLLPGLIATFSFRWAGRQVANWVIQTQGVTRP